MLDPTYRRPMPLPKPPRNYWRGFLTALLWTLLCGAGAGVIVMLVNRYA